MPVGLVRMAPQERTVPPALLDPLDAPEEGESGVTWVTLVMQADLVPPGRRDHLDPLEPREMRETGDLRVHLVSLVKLALPEPRERRERRATRERKEHTVHQALPVNKVDRACVETKDPLDQTARREIMVQLGTPETRDPRDPLGRRASLETKDPLDPTDLTAGGEILVTPEHPETLVLPEVLAHLVPLGSRVPRESQAQTVSLETMDYLERMAAPEILVLTELGESLVIPGVWEVLERKETLGMMAHLAKTERLEQRDRVVDLDNRVTPDSLVTWEDLETLVLREHLACPAREENPELKDQLVLMDLRDQPDHQELMENKVFLVTQVTKACKVRVASMEPRERRETGEDKEPRVNREKKVFLECLDRLV